MKSFNVADAGTREALAYLVSEINQTREAARALTRVVSTVVDRVADLEEETIAPLVAAVEDLSARLGDVSVRVDLDTGEIQ